MGSYYNCNYCYKPKCACGVCHNCTVKFGYGGLLPDPKTQKARGMGVLAGHVSDISVLPVLGLIQTKSDLNSLCPKWLTSGIVFARPCPKTPRHGFVDSRVVTSKEDLQALFDETIAADPDGEVMLTQRIDAKLNAVWTPGLLTVGSGHDGATCGRDTISFPLAGKIPEGLSPSVLDSAGIEKDQWPYIEAVLAKGQYYIDSSPLTITLTQLRAGPKLEGVSTNFIPDPVEVKRVVVVDGQSLLEWETLMQGVKGEPGVVVYHPGGSLTDHYTVHARTFNVPIIIDGPCPMGGDLLVPESAAVEIDPIEVLRGVMIGERIPMARSKANRSSAIDLMLLGLYNSAVMGGKSSKWIGISTALMLRFGSAALSGEARHAPKKSGSSNVKTDRQTVYTRVLDKPLSYHRGRLGELIKILRYGFDVGAVGVGGEKWAKCGAVLMPLFNNLKDLAYNPTRETVGAMIRSLNIAVDQAHNGGWWLNKFTRGDRFEEIQDGDLGAMLGATEAIWKVKGIEISDVDLAKWIDRVAHWDQVKFVPPKVMGANLQITPDSGVVGVVVQLKDRVIPIEDRMIPITAGKIISKLSGLLSNLYVVPTEKGITVEAHMGGQSVVLYEEDDLDHVEAGVTWKKS